MRIAIIGSGISGLGAALALQADHEITVFERERRAGGHANTLDVDYEGQRIAVDTGFIVYNELNYPNLTALFAHLQVPTEASVMSFALSRDGGRHEWGGDTLGTLFAQKRNLVSPKFLTMVRDILRFNRQAQNDLARGVIGDGALSEYLDRHRFSQVFRNDYLVPMAAAIWSSPLEDVLDFPARSLIGFFDNHRLLTGFEGRPVWRTVKGGSRVYVDKIAKILGPRLRLADPVQAVRRVSGGIEVATASGGPALYDQVILATHGDITNTLVQDADASERAILSAIRYAPNRAYLHRDPDLMPKRRKVWSSWNLIAERDADGRMPVTVTYWMNKLQNLDPSKPLFVTLNPIRPPRTDLTFAVLDYDHPQYDTATLAAQENLDKIQGRGGLWYAGAWTAHGFHEDGLRSGLVIAQRLGAKPAFAPGRAA